MIDRLQIMSCATATDKCFNVSVKFCRQTQLKRTGIKGISIVLSVSALSLNIGRIYVSRVKHLQGTWDLKV